VARGALAARAFASHVRPALIHGAAGVIAFDGENPFAILAFTVVAGRIAAIDIFHHREMVPKLLGGRPAGWTELRTGTPSWRALCSAGRPTAAWPTPPGRLRACPLALVVYSLPTLSDRCDDALRAAAFAQVP
jgi:hypothetical protein